MPAVFWSQGFLHPLVPNNDGVDQVYRGTCMDENTKFLGWWYILGGGQAR